jgi:cytochrome c5
MRVLVIGALLLAAAGVVVAYLERRPERPASNAAANVDRPELLNHGPFDEALPSLGAMAVVTPLPDAPGKAIAETRCQVCHSGDMLRQQRLTETQWTAEITKMIGWGSELTDPERAVLLPYLTMYFGTENDRFAPLAVRPAGR